MSVRSKLLEKYGSVFSLEQYMWCEDRNAILFVVFERFPISNDEIVKVSRHIFETAKQTGYHYLGVDIDVILDDNPRLPYS